MKQYGAFQVLNLSAIRTNPCYVTPNPLLTPQSVVDVVACIAARLGDGVAQKQRLAADAGKQGREG